jgi:OOP family OmpA-OmpF porin
VSRSRRLRHAAIAGVAAGALAAPAAAQDAPVGQEQLDESVVSLDTEASVLDIEIDGSVESLQTERERGGRVTVTVAADVLFEFDRARLTQQARTTVSRVARRIRAARGPVRVDGYTDSIGSGSYNLDLSRRRAAAVSEALRADVPGGIDISSRGFGEANPVAPNTTPSGEDNPLGRAKNRRVTISFPRG